MTCRLSHHCLTNRARPDVSAKVDRGSLRVEHVEESTERLPWLARIGLLSEGEVGPCRIHFAGDLAGDSLRDLGDRMRRTKDHVLRVAEHVDESRGDDLIVSVDDACRRHSGKGRPDVRDSIAAHSNAATIPGISRPVDDARVGYEKVIWCGCGSCADRRRARRGDDKEETARPQSHDLIPGFGFVQETLRVFFLRKSMRMNWPRVIVLVKYALPRLISETFFTNSTSALSRASMNVLMMIPERLQFATSLSVSLTTARSSPIEFL